jgi:hypothetical protein
MCSEGWSSTLNSELLHYFVQGGKSPRWFSLRGMSPGKCIFFRRSKFFPLFFGAIWSVQRRRSPEWLKNDAWMKWVGRVRLQFFHAHVFVVTVTVLWGRYQRHFSAFRNIYWSLFPPTRANNSLVRPPTKIFPKVRKLRFLFLGFCSSKIFESSLLKFEIPFKIKHRYVNVSLVPQLLQHQDTNKRLSH